MKKINTDELAKGISAGDFVKLAQGITLVESDAEDHWPLAKDLLQKLKGKQTPTLRVGLSGPPGVGKSTFIEAFGGELVKAGKKVAVLAVDPSSEISGGSILGDKTRMEELSKNPLAFVRPSPSRGHLGGVTTSMPAILNLCEAAGFDLILIETVGIGQSEADVRLMVDKLILLAQPGAGDELQGIKKGILEYVDYIVVNKADLDAKMANATKTQLLAALKVMRGKNIPVSQVSALKSEGLKELIDALASWTIDSQQRAHYQLRWFKSLLMDRFSHLLESHPQWAAARQTLENQISQGQLLPTEACEKFFDEVR